MQTDKDSKNKHKYSGARVSRSLKPETGMESPETRQAPRPPGRMKRPWAVYANKPARASLSCRSTGCFGVIGNLAGWRGSEILEQPGDRLAMEPRKIRLGAAHDGRGFILRLPADINEPAGRGMSSW
jgi:hypothetical protein